jgi:hypothetical protein
LPLELSIVEKLMENIIENYLSGVKNFLLGNVMVVLHKFGNSVY